MFLPTLVQTAMCLVLDAHRCSTVIAKSYVPYFPSGRSALFVVRDAHHYSAVVAKSYVPYSPSGRNALYVVRDAHRYSAVVVESYLPYSPSGRNELCVVLDAHLTVPSLLKVTRTLLSFRPQYTVCSARRAPLLCRRCCHSTHFCSQAKIRHRYWCCSKLRGRFHEDSRSVRHAEIETQNLSRMS